MSGETALVLVRQRQLKWKSLDWLEAVLMTLCGFTLAGFCTSVICDIVTREIGRPWLWLQEVTSTFFIYGIFIVFLLANIIMLPLGWLTVRVATKVLKVARNILMPTILLFCIVGAFAVTNSVLGVVLILCFGVVAFLMEENGFPVAPAILGVVLGGLSGYVGGKTDQVIQRLIELLQSLPTIPIWLALSAALPRDWTPIQVFFAITVILSLVGWTTLGREVRGRFLALREEDFVLAARLAGCSRMRIILRHMVPTFVSHIIATSSLAIPVMIINETSLSFLGLGIRPPAISWGVLLQEAQNIQTLALAPWLLIPGLVVIVSVLAFNLVGDGLRDAADPYSN